MSLDDKVGWDVCCDTQHMERRSHWMVCTSCGRSVATSPARRDRETFDKLRKAYRRVLMLTGRPS